MTTDALASAFPLLTAAQLAQISALSENITIEKGGHLLREGHDIDSIFLITHGVADLVKTLVEKSLERCPLLATFLPPRP
jgi:CRP-like cAMP-binding protein